MRLTAKQHGEYREYLLGVRDGCDVTEPDAGDDGEAEIERRDVAGPSIRATGRVIRQVRSARPASQLIQPANGRVQTRSLEEGDGIEDARKPVRDEDERSHQQQQNGGTVLRVLVNASRHTQQTQQTCRLHQPRHSHRLYSPKSSSTFYSLKLKSSFPKLTQSM